MHLAYFMFGGTYTLSICRRSIFPNLIAIRLCVSSGWMMLRLHPCAPMSVEPGTAMLLIP